jgi:hypothetical protein
VRPKKALAVVAASTVIFVMAMADSVAAFGVGTHEYITVGGLSPTQGGTFSFLRPAIVHDIADQHDQIDSGVSGGRDERHFDDCEFDGGVKFIRDRYADAMEALVDYKPWNATDEFGDALHTAMDFYAHSNWVEMGFPKSDVATTATVEVRRTDLIDLSGAQTSIAQRWFAPANGATVRDDILLGNDEWTIPAKWSIDPDGGGHFVPTLRNDGRTLGRILITGEGWADDECDVYHASVWPWVGREYDGPSHDDLNKDAPNPSRPGLHEKALAMAMLQTSYEWCRLVYEAGRVQRDGFLLATWVRNGGNPHPAGTPCATAPPGPTPVVVTIDRVTVLDAHDDGADPGEIQLAMTLFDDRNFGRSVHVQNTAGSMALPDGAIVPADRLPAPLMLCVPFGSGATFAVHGWDNDDDRHDLNANELDTDGDDDDLLIGFQSTFGSVLPSGQQVARTDDLEVRYHVDRVANPNAPLGLCPSAGPNS